VRIDAPSFAALTRGDPMLNAVLMGTMNVMPGDGGTGNGDQDEPELPFSAVDGTFTLRTDAAILANNTDEGPSREDDGLQMLTWNVDATTPAAPTALIAITP
jgi:hypothetical protein